MYTTDDWLPIGSVVNTVGGEEYLMIVGYMCQDVRTGRLWDYAALGYPEGFVSSSELRMFDRTAVDTVFYIGYQDFDTRSFHDILLGTQTDFEAAKIQSIGDEEERREYADMQANWKRLRAQADERYAEAAREAARRAGVALNLGALDRPADAGVTEGE